jgi:hypothetical protein
MYYTKIGDAQLSIVDYSNKVVTSINNALADLMAKEMDAVLPTGADAQIHALQQLHDDLLPKWVAVGQALANGVPAAYDETTWRNLGATYLQQAMGVQQDAVQASPVKAIENAVDASITDVEKAAVVVSTEIRKVSTEIRKGFTHWPWIAGGALVFIVVRAMFNPRR